MATEYGNYRCHHSNSRHHVPRHRINSRSNVRCMETADTRRRLDFLADNLLAHEILEAEAEIGIVNE